MLKVIWVIHYECVDMNTESLLQFIKAYKVMKFVNTHTWQFPKVNSFKLFKK